MQSASTSARTAASAGVARCPRRTQNWSAGLGSSPVFVVTIRRCGWERMKVTGGIETSMPPWADDELTAPVDRVTDAAVSAGARPGVADRWITQRSLGGLAARACTAVAPACVAPCSTAAPTVETTTRATQVANRRRVRMSGLSAPVPPSLTAARKQAWCCCTPRGGVGLLVRRGCQHPPRLNRPSHGSRAHHRPRTLRTGQDRLPPGPSRRSRPGRPPGRTRSA